MGNPDKHGNTLFPQASAKRSHASFALTLISLIAFSVPALAKSAKNLPVPGYGTAKEVPGAQQTPDPNLTYKVVFNVVNAAPKVNQANPGLVTVARYLNTLAKYGVPADHRKLVVVISRFATPIVLDNAAFRARYQGVDNPNIALMRSLTNAGVTLRVCGQAVAHFKIDPKTIQPDVHHDLWALSSTVNYELRGYVHIMGVIGQ